MDIRFPSWKDINLEELAQFSVQVRRQEGLAPESMTTDTLLKAIEWWTNRNDSTPIIAYVNERMVGWLVFFSFLPTIATIGRWHPIVAPSPLKDEIAQQLLKVSIDLAKSRHYSRLEAEVTGITPENEFGYGRGWDIVHIAESQDNLFDRFQGLPGRGETGFEHLDTAFADHLFALSFSLGKSHAGW